MVADNTFRGRFGIPFLAAIMLALTAGTALSQTRTPPVAGGEKPKTPQQLQDEQVHQRLADAWTALLSGKHAEAIKLAEPVAALKEQRYQYFAVEAAHVTARANFLSGTPQGRNRAQQLWKQIERASSSQATANRLTIAKALALEAEAQSPNVKPDESAAKVKAAIDLLEPMLKARRWDIATVEAALDASRLYVAAKRFDDAKKTLDYIISYLGVERNIIVMEIPPGLAEPYVKAAQDALKRLKYDRDAGREEFEAAERLRRQSKFAEAMRAYMAIARDFADTDYGPRAELHIGDCLVGLRRQPEAIAHWRKFVETKPAGSYRAQALVSLIDTFLDEQLNLPDAARYGELARATLPTALADEKAGPSWRLGEYDICIRVGLVSLVTGKSEDAVAAFTRAKAIADKKTVAESLDALIAAAKSGKGVIPDDVKGSGAAGAATASPSDKVALALSMGIIHLVAGRLDNADAFLDRVLGTPAIAAKPGTPGQPARPAMQGATQAQIAFATFGRGAVLHARRKEADAKEAFLASIKMHSAGNWHDESLYRVASITQDAAASKFAKAPEPAAKAGQPAKPPTPQEREAAAKAEKERLAAFLKAKGEALPYWQELITRYPKSPRVEQAMYNAGVLLCELAEAAPAAQAEKAWKDAAFMLNRFCEFYPKSPLAGDAYVRQVDIAMERMFDLDLSRQLTTAAADWAKARPEFAADEAPASSEAWRAMAKRTAPTEIRPTVYKIFLRAGLVAYLDQRYDAAQRFFESAKPLTPPRDFVVVEGRIPTGIESIITASREKRTLTPQEVFDGDAKVRLILQLADIYLVAGSYQKSNDLASLIVEDLARAASVPQRSWAHRQRAMALSSLRLKLDAKPEFIAAYQACPTASWAGECLFLAGTIVHNHAKNPTEAIGIFEDVVRKYPTGEFAAKAAYFVGVIHEWNGQWTQAKTAYQRVIRDYPESRWASAAMGFHLKKVDAALAAAKTNKPGER